MWTWIRRRVSVRTLRVNRWLAVLLLGLLALAVRSTFRTSDGGWIREHETAVHRHIRSWHLADPDHRTPVLSAIVSPQWRAYPSHLLHKYRSPPLHRAVKVPKHLHSLEKKLMQTFHVNVVASDLMSLNRRLPDVRNPKCQLQRYLPKLPNASVIIIFNNEAQSIVLRTVHSVINRSPDALLHEVILVDDFSQNEALKRSLDEAVATLPVTVKIHRLAEREGLIKARLAGAEVASGSVLIFLDAHIEVSHGWLEPLLTEIAGDRSRVALPVVDDLVDQSLEYVKTGDERDRGGLDWDLMHAWIEGTQPLADQQDWQVESFATPTMIGCAFAIDREYFFASGSFDSQMSIWGGENVELSLRVWRCGGSLLVAPCSRIGHVYRNSTPHTIPGDLKSKKTTVLFNTGRFAQVWLAQFNEFYRFTHPGVESLPLGDLTPRLQILDRFQCHSMDWFLDFVYPDSPFPHRAKYLGQIQLHPDGSCIEVLNAKGVTGMRQCHGLGTKQLMLYSRLQEIRSSVDCLQPTPLNSTSGTATRQVSFFSCDLTDQQKWTFQRTGVDAGVGLFVHRPTNHCLTSDQSDAASMTPKSLIKFLASVVKDTQRQRPTDWVTLVPCRQATGYSGQVWSLERAAAWRIKGPGS